jgi:hypothetical protein
MAEKQKQASDNEKIRPASADAAKPASSGASLFDSIVLGAVAALGKVWNALTEDGLLAAAARQGADELGAALKAFPDSIQVQEHGALWNPLQSEVAADRQQGKKTGNHFSSSGSRDLWPSEIADQNKHQSGKDHGGGHENGHDAGHSM